MIFKTNEMPKFRKKPVIIEAFQFVGHNGIQLKDWSKGKIVPCACLDPIEANPSGQYVMIHTLEGIISGYVNDWIIKGIKGEFYPCKPDIFDSTYELV